MMYIFKNAITSITRNKGRNILLGIILLVIGCTTTVTLAIRSSATKLINSYEKKYDVEATISVNRENMKNNMKKPEEEKETTKEDNLSSLKEKFSSASNISIDDIKNYADSKYVKSYYYKESLSMNSNNIESSTTNKNNNKRPGSNKQEVQESSGDFNIIGYSSIEAMTEFISGNYKMAEGSISDDLTTYTCIINSELATLNNLSVGDKIVLTNPNNESLTYELTITGIYEENATNHSEISMFSDSINQIITNIKVVEDIKSADSTLNVKNTPTFILTSKDVIDSFTNEVSEKGLSEYLTITTNQEQIISATNSVSNLKSYATTFLIITIIIGVIVLLVLNAINIRERKYEIGVLRTIGMKKSLLTCQFALELLIVTLVSLSIGATFGAVISVPVSNQLLQNEINSSKEQVQDINKNFGHGEKDNFNFQKINGVFNIEAYDSINAVVDLKVLAELFGIGIALTLVSSISSMISIQKFSPLQILKERS